MIKTEYLIVGQGLAGSLLAWEMSQHNLDFQVMDSSSLPKSSLVAAGLYNPLMFNKLRISRMTEELWPIMFQTYQNIEKKTGSKLLHAMKSIKMLNDEELEEWESNKTKLPGKYIESVSIPGKLKGYRNYSGMGTIKESGFLDIPLLIDSIKQLLREQKRYLSHDLDHSSIVFQKETIHIENIIAANNIVFCEGAAMINNPWFKHAGMHPNKGEIIEIETEIENQEAIVRDSLFMLPYGKKTFRVGASYLHNDLSLLPNKNNLPKITDRLNQMIAVPYTITDHKAGLRPAIRDRMPVLGAHPKFTNLLVLNGMGSRGVVFAPYCAKILVEHLQNRNFSIPPSLNVLRYLYNK